MSGERMFSNPSAQEVPGNGQEQEIKPVVSVQEGNKFLKMNDLEAGGGGGLMLKKNREEGFSGEYAPKDEVMTAIMESGLGKAEINSLIKSLDKHSLRIVKKSDGGHSTVHAFTEGEKVGGGGIISKKSESAGSLEVGAELVQIPEFEKRKKEAMAEARELSLEIQADEAVSAVEVKPILPPLTPPELHTYSNRRGDEALASESMQDSAEKEEENETEEKKKHLKLKRHIAAGAIALAMSAAATLGAGNGSAEAGAQEAPDFGSGAGIEVAQENLSDGLAGLAELDGSIFGAPTVEQDFSYDIGGTVDLPHVEAAPEAEANEYATPWNWAEDQPERNGAESTGWLKSLGAMAEADGHTVEWSYLPNGDLEMVRVDGEDDTAFVTNILDQYK